MIDTIGLVFITGGLVFDIMGALGLLRLPDVYNRLQAGTKSVTLGAMDTIRCGWRAGVPARESQYQRGLGRLAEAAQGRRLAGSQRLEPFRQDLGIKHAAIGMPAAFRDGMTLPGVSSRELRN
mgnify:CR=1 FL=1